MIEGGVETMAMPQRDNTIEVIKRLDALLEYAVMHGDEVEAERMAERLSGIEDVEIEVAHTAKQYWTTNHAREDCDIIFQEESR